MSDEKKFDWSEWASKQGAFFVLLVAVGAFFRWDVWLPVRGTMEKQTEILGRISETQVQIRDEQRRGVWRVTEPPTPSELPKGVPAARDEP